MQISNILLLFFSLFGIMEQENARRFEMRYVNKLIFTSDVLSSQMALN